MSWQSRKNGGPTITLISISLVKDTSTAVILMDGIARTDLLTYISQGIFGQVNGAKQCYLKNNMTTLYRNKYFASLGFDNLTILESANL